MDDEFTDDELELTDLAPGEPTAADLRDPGLYPRFLFFHAATRPEFVKLIPGQLNILLSAYSGLVGYDKSGRERDDMLKEAEVYCHNARLVFLDSGVFTPLVACAKGKKPPEAVLRWMDSQDRVIEAANRLAARGVKGVVAMTDLPNYEELLGPAGITVQQAQDLTVRNAIAMKQAYDDGRLPKDWKPVYMAQGLSVDDYVACVERYRPYGIIDDVNAGRAWFGVGGTRNVRPPLLFDIYRGVREHLGEGHIHALGIARFTELTYMTARDWVQSADATTAILEVVKNVPKNPYHVHAARPVYLTHGLWAAATKRFDTLLARAIKAADEKEIVDQPVLEEVNA